MVNRYYREIDYYAFTFNYFSHSKILRLIAYPGGKPVNKLLADTGDGIELTEDDISLSTAERGEPNSLLPQPPQSTLEEGNADEGNEDENDGGYYLVKTLNNHGKTVYLIN